MEIFHRVLEGESVDAVEAQFVGKYGEIVLVEGSANCLFRDRVPVATRGIFRDVTERKQVEEARVDRAAAIAKASELARSRRRIIIAQESLRREIARQIHGGVQSRLIVIINKLMELERVVSTEDIVPVLRALRCKLIELNDNQIRTISHQLYPSILRRGLIPALQSLEDQYTSSFDIRMDLDGELIQRERGDRQLIPEDVRQGIYRIAEEALTNALKHSRGSIYTLTLSWSPEEYLELQITDNGQGFELDVEDTGIGLMMMQYYAMVVNGTCDIRSGLGSGTTVRATLPLGELNAEYPE